MNRLESFESFIESVVEDSLFNRLHTRGHPVEIAKRLARTMEDETCIWSDGRFVAPDKYVVQLRPEAYGVYQNVRDIIEQDLAEYIQNAAGEKKPPVHFLIPPTIRLETSRDIGRRRILVKAYWGEDNHKREAGPLSEMISKQAVVAQPALRSSIRTSLANLSNAYAQSEQGQYVDPNLVALDLTNLYESLTPKQRKDPSVGIIFQYCGPLAKDLISDPKMLDLIDSGRRK